MLHMMQEQHSLKIAEFSARVKRGHCLGSAQVVAIRQYQGLLLLLLLLSLPLTPPKLEAKEVGCCRAGCISQMREV